MPKTISVSEAKNNLSAMLKWAVANRDEVIVESHGRPKAVILPYEEYETFLSLREKERRRDALRRLQKVAASVQGRSQDLTPEEAESLADEVTRETIDRMIGEGKISYEGS